MVARTMVEMPGAGCRLSPVGGECDSYALALIRTGGSCGFCTYPPDLQEEATRTVLEQSESLCGEWAA